MNYDIKMLLHVLISDTKMNITFFSFTLNDYNLLNEHRVEEELKLAIETNSRGVAPCWSPEVMQV